MVRLKLASQSALLLPSRQSMMNLNVPTIVQQIFNVTMLGKQGWKFQTDTTSLVTRLFKARYFSNSSFQGS